MTGKKPSKLDIQWTKSNNLVDYSKAVSYMENKVKLINTRDSKEEIWFLEHGSIYTAGTSSGNISGENFQNVPVYKTNRGGKLTWHGPGQRIIYIMLDIKKRNYDVRSFVHNIEQWMIDTLKHFNIKGERRKERVGVWVVTPPV